MSKYAKKKQSSNQRIAFFILMCSMSIEYQFYDKPYLSMISSLTRHEIREKHQCVQKTYKKSKVEEAK